VAVHRRTHEEIVVHPEDDRDVYWTLDKRHWDIARRDAREAIPKKYARRNLRPGTGTPVRIA
jgi:hypothetical protein